MTEFKHTSTSYTHTFTFPEGTKMPAGVAQYELIRATVEVYPEASDDDPNEVLLFTDVTFYGYNLTKGGQRFKKDTYPTHIFPTRFVSIFSDNNRLEWGGLLEVELIRAALAITPKHGYPLAEQHLLDYYDAQIAAREPIEES